MKLTQHKYFETKAAAFASRPDENAKEAKDKKQTQVTERTLKMLEFEHLADGDEIDDDGHMELVPLNEFETEKFL